MACLEGHERRSVLAMARVDVKIVLLGQQSIGKSCLLDRYITGFFEGQPKNTIGAAFAAKKVTLQNGRVISLGIWDTAGAERFQSISRMYYHGSRAAVICFSPGSQQSFAKAKFWVQEVTEHEPDCKLYFALTKCDLLEQLPGIGTDASHLEPSPQESGTHSSHCSAATLLLLDSDKRKALLGCSSCFDCLTCDADQSDLAATPDSGKDSFSSEEGIAICQQEVSDEDISAYAKLHQAQVFSTSAKTGIGVRRMFSSIAQDLAAGTMQESHVQHTHRHAARPVTPTFMSSRPGTNPSSPLENSHNSTYSRTRKKYCQNCCF